MGHRMRIRHTAAAAALLLASLLLSGAALAQEATAAKIAEGISTLQKERAEQQKSKDEKSREAANLQTQVRQAEAAGDNEKVAQLKSRHYAIAEELNTIDRQLAEKDRSIEGKFAELRLAARKELSAQVANAAKTAATDPEATASAIRSADLSLSEWERGMKEWKSYTHSPEALPQPSKLPANRTRAVSEQSRLKDGLAALEAERDLEAAELKELESLAATTVAHANWPALKKKLESHKKTVTDRKADIESRIAAGKERMKVIEAYLEE